jgi:transposase-like protein
VDETYVGGVESGVHGRETETKPVVAAAAEEDGRGIGRIRLRRVQDVSAESLLPFVRDVVEPGSEVRTDSWAAHTDLRDRGYKHKVRVLRRSRRAAHELMPRVHRVASLLKRWLLGTHQGAVSPEHLDYYLDELTFRFNRRRALHSGRLAARPWLASTAGLYCMTWFQKFPIGVVGATQPRGAKKHPSSAFRRCSTSAPIS